VFIVVSGFSLTIAPARRDWRLTQGLRTYLRRRAWRILPTYWAALLFSCIVFGVITGDVTGDKVSGKGVLVHALLLQDVIGSPSPNGAFWSIAVEWQIYFLFPLFLLIRRRWGVGSLLASVSAVIVLSYLLATSQPAFERLLNLTPQFVILFVFGMAAGEGVRRKVWRRPELGLPAAGLLLVALVAVLVSQDLFWVEREYFWVDLLAGAATAVVLWSLAIGRGAGLGRFLASRPLAGTGGFSYSIYCMHLPLMWLVWHFGLAPLELSPLGGLALLFAVALPVVLVGSYVFSQVFEQPFLRHRSFRELGNGFIRREKSRTDGAMTPSR
jgi:peptidoglycan/LPS O-acetylase OafA/YrhL